MSDTNTKPRWEASSLNFHVFRIDVDRRTREESLTMVSHPDNPLTEAGAKTRCAQLNAGFYPTRFVVKETPTS